jgi:serine protease AprX
MRLSRASTGAKRSNALWGRGTRGGVRGNALWGRGGRRFGALAATLTLAFFVAAATAAARSTQDGSSPASTFYVQPSLLSAMQANPNATYDVIVVGDGSHPSSYIAQEVAHSAADANQQLSDAFQGAQSAVQDAQHHVVDAASQAAKAQQDLAGARAQLAVWTRLAATLPLGSGKLKDALLHEQGAAQQLQQETQQYQQVQGRLAQAQQLLAAAQAAAQAAVQQAQAAPNALQQTILQQFSSVSGIEAHLTGDQIQQLINDGTKAGLRAILSNETVLAGPPTGSWAGSAGPSGQSGAGGPPSNSQTWSAAVGAPAGWAAVGARTPTIAIVDSGIDAGRADFAGRVIGQVDLASLSPNSAGDGNGHGTFVAGIAAGSAVGYAGVAPAAKILSLDVADDQGEATVADLIHACDWILQNKATYNIRVVNFSLEATTPASILFDPLDQAVERLWLSGVVVVTSAGNYASNGQESGVEFAPGNDPFVITVGAADISNPAAGQATAAPWSAWGYTPDGFIKPDLSAPGRHIIAPVSPNATLYSQRSADVVAPGYMELSGTSFSAPMVTGAAADLLGLHPTWTPDQVKGALMVSAAAEPAAQPGALGVGDLDIAAAVEVADPPNPNAGLDQYLVTGSRGSTVFDATAWQTAAGQNPAWDAAAWASAAWASAAWASAAWASAAWASAAWSDAAWASAAWSDAAWSDAAWADAAWADNAANDPPVDPNTLTAAPTP